MRAPIFAVDSDMPIDSEAQQDIVANYWQAYFEWRTAYGLSDTCMGELLAALRVEADAPSISPEQRTRLNALARMIEMELIAERDTRRAA